MNNCWILILLLLCCNNNRSGCGCGNNVCERKRNTECDKHECDSGFGIGINKPSDCGCDDDFIQPRSFFGNSGTCGCENKTE